MKTAYQDIIDINHIASYESRENMNDILALGQLENITQESGYPRLARILVGDLSLRNQGLGRYFIKLLLEESKRLYNTDSVELFTWEKPISIIAWRILM